MPSPSTLDLVATLLGCGLLLGGGALSLLLLPWTDADVARTVGGIRDLFSRPRPGVLMPSGR